MTHKGWNAFASLEDRLGDYPTVSIPPMREGPHGPETWDWDLAAWVALTAAQKQLLRKNPKQVDPKEWKAAGQIRSAKGKGKGFKRAAARRTRGDRCRRADGRFQRC